MMQPPMMGGGPQPHAPMPPMPPGRDGFPPEADGIEAMVQERLAKLSPQDAQAIATGISPQAMAAIERVLPEIAAVLEMAKGGARPPMPPGGPPSMMPPGPGPAEGPSQFQRPATALGRI